MSFATRAKTTATRLINKYGNSGTLVSVTLGAYSPTTTKRAETTVNTPTRYTLRQYSLKEIETGLVSAHDVELTFVSDIEVNESFRFTLNDGSTLNLVNIQKIEVQNLAIIYKSRGVSNA